MSVLRPDPGLIRQGMFDQDNITPTGRVIARLHDLAMGDGVNRVTQVGIASAPAVPIFAGVPHPKSFEVSRVAYNRVNFIRVENINIIATRSHRKVKAIRDRYTVRSFLSHTKSPSF